MTYGNDRVNFFEGPDKGIEPISGEPRGYMVTRVNGRFVLEPPPAVVQFKLSRAVAQEHRTLKEAA
ncbi:MAG TPA: hypothetical protein VJG64_02040 [Candidatus Paceibacterota bacterium]